MPRGPTITVTCDVGHQYAPFLRRSVRAAMAHMTKLPAALSVAVVSASTISRLNRSFLRRNGATDVLAFEISTDALGQLAEGEIVICLDIARLQARQRGHTVENELVLYALHGLLHLCGYKDDSRAEAARMHDREDEILKAIGVGPVFAPSKTGLQSRATKSIAVRKAPT